MIDSERCCRFPDKKMGFIGFKFMKVEACWNCRQVMFVGGRFAGFIFEYILSCFWNGYVTIYEEGDK